MSTHRKAPPERSLSDAELAAINQQGYAQLRAEQVDRLRGRYWQTKNPLYVWEAIAVGANTGEPIPEWCLEYLHDAAINLTELASKVRARRKDPSAKRAMQRVTNALLLSRQGKNMFASLAADRRNMGFARQFAFMEFGAQGAEELDRSGKPPLNIRALVWGYIKSELNVASDRAQRVLTEGLRRLSGSRVVKPPP